MSSPDKERLRTEVGRRIGRLSPSLRVRFDERICELVLESTIYAGAAQVLLYTSLEDEVDVGLVRDDAVGAGRAVFLPCVQTGTGVLRFRRWRRGDPLHRGAYGVLEPIGGDPPEKLASLVLVPGRAFTRSGARLGRGRGCYDRVFAELMALGPTVGVAYECQLAESIEEEAHDHRVGYLVTETGLRRTTETERGGAVGARG